MQQDSSVKKKQMMGNGNKAFQNNHKDFWDKLQIRSFFFTKIRVFFVSYLLLHLVLAKIRYEEKLIGRDNISIGDAAGGNGQLQEEKLVLLTISALLCISWFNKEYH